MRDVFPPRTAMCAPFDPQVPYPRMAELHELACATFPEASFVASRWYDGQPIVEVYANGGARVLTRAQVLEAGSC